MPAVQGPAALDLTARVTALLPLRAAVEALPRGLRDNQEAMAEAIERKGLLFTTGYFMRTDPKTLFLREQVAPHELVRGLADHVCVFAEGEVHFRRVVQWSSGPVI